MRIAQMVVSAAVTPVAVISLAAGLAGADPLVMGGKLDEVTVYRGQALVTRNLDVSGHSGLVEIVVTDLPEQIQPASLYAEAPGGSKIRAVSFRTRAVSDDVRKEVRDLDDAIALVNLEIESLQEQLRVIDENAKSLESLNNFTATTSSSDLSKGTLNAETLERMASFLFAQRAKFSEDRLKNQVALREANSKLQLAQRQRAELTGSANRVAREALLTIDVQDANVPVKLRYIVNNASWSPSYSINASTGSSEVLVSYQASVAQMTGEDWSNVKMVLSTATPNAIAAAPMLEPLAIQLSQNEVEKMNEQQNQAYAQQLRLRQDKAISDLKSNSGNHDEDGQNTLYANGEVEFSGMPFKDIQRDNVYAARINARNSLAVAGDIQRFELVNRDVSASHVVSDAERHVTVTYETSGRSTLQSRSDRQLIEIASEKMPATMYKLAVPLMTPDVYSEAILTNVGGHVLLGGPSVSYLDGQFVGQGEIPTVSAGGNFRVGLGVDPTLHASRELVDRKDDIRGGNRIISLSYRINIENFADNPADVRVISRIPQSDGQQIRVMLGEMSQPLSDAPEAKKAQKKSGLLRWDVSVPAKSIGQKEMAIDYALTLEHDKSLNIQLNGPSSHGPDVRSVYSPYDQMDSILLPTDE